MNAPTDITTAAPDLGLGAVHTPDEAVAALPYEEIWAADFEFQAPDGERPRPICMVAKELLSGRTLKLWRNKLLSLGKAPFRTDERVLFVAYFNSAEMGCFLELGWPMPVNCLDLYCEFRAKTNGLTLYNGSALRTNLPFAAVLRVI